MRSPTRSTPSMLTPALIAVLTLSLLVVHSPSACADCPKSDPETGLICAEDVPDYPGWRLLCADGCVLYTVEDAATAQADNKRARLVPRLRLALDASILTGRAQEGEIDALGAEVDRLHAEADARWRPTTWIGIGAGGVLLLAVGVVVAGVAL